MSTFVSNWLTIIHIGESLVLGHRKGNVRDTKYINIKLEKQVGEANMLSSLEAEQVGNHK